MSSIDNPSSETPFSPPTVEPSAPDISWIPTWTGDLAKTGTGLNLVLLGTIFVPVSVLVLLSDGALFVVSSVVHDWISRQAAGVLVWMGGGAELLALIGILVGGLMLFVGPFRCLSAPAAARGRGLIIGSVVCQTLAGITYFGSFLPMISRLEVPTSIIIAIAGLASHILFVLFMRRIAAFIGRMDLVTHARNILIGAAIMASCVGIQGIAHLVARNPGDVLVATAIMGVTVALLVYVNYLGLLNALRRAISPNGQRIVSGGDDKTVKIWDASETALPATPNKPQTQVDEPSVQAVDASKLVKRSGLIYERDSETPFTGVMVKNHENGQKEKEATYKDGKQDGLATTWYENGQKWSEATYKDGKVEGLATTWHENGQKAREETLKDGKKVSETKWDEEGNEIKE